MVSLVTHGASTRISCDSRLIEEKTGGGRDTSGFLLNVVQINWGLKPPCLDGNVKESEAVKIRSCLSHKSIFMCLEE